MTMEFSVVLKQELIANKDTNMTVFYCLTLFDSFRQFFIF